MYEFSEIYELFKEWQIYHQTDALMKSLISNFEYAKNFPN